MANPVAPVKSLGGFKGNGFKKPSAAISNKGSAWKAAETTVVYSRGFTTWTTTTTITLPTAGEPAIPPFRPGLVTAQEYALRRDQTTAWALEGLAADPGLSNVLRVRRQRPSAHRKRLLSSLPQVLCLAALYLASDALFWNRTAVPRTNPIPMQHSSEQWQQECSPPAESTQLSREEAPSQRGSEQLSHHSPQDSANELRGASPETTTVPDGYAWQADPRSAYLGYGSESQCPATQAGQDFGGSPAGQPSTSPNDSANQTAELQRPALIDEGFIGSDDSTERQQHKTCTAESAATYGMDLTCPAFAESSADSCPEEQQHKEQPQGGTVPRGGASILELEGWRGIGFLEWAKRNLHWGRRSVDKSPRHTGATDVGLPESQGDFLQLGMEDGPVPGDYTLGFSGGNGTASAESAEAGPLSADQCGWLQGTESATEFWSFSEQPNAPSSEEAGHATAAAAPDAKDPGPTVPPSLFLHGAAFVGFKPSWDSAGLDGPKSSWGRKGSGGNAVCPLPGGRAETEPALSPGNVSGGPPVEREFGWDDASLWSHSRGTGTRGAEFHGTAGYLTASQEQWLEAIASWQSSQLLGGGRSFRGLRTWLDDWAWPLMGGGGGDELRTGTAVAVFKGGAAGWRGASAAEDAAQPLRKVGIPWQDATAALLAATNLGLIAAVVVFGRRLQRQLAAALQEAADLNETATATAAKPAAIFTPDNSLAAIRNPAPLISALKSTLPKEPPPAELSVPEQDGGPASPLGQDMKSPLLAKTVSWVPGTPAGKRLSRLASQEMPVLSRSFSRRASFTGMGDGKLIAAVHETEALSRSLSRSPSRGSISGMPSALGPLPPDIAPSRQSRDMDPGERTRELMSLAIMSLGLWLGASGHYAKVFEEPAAGSRPKRVSGDVVEVRPYVYQVDLPDDDSEPPSLTIQNLQGQVVAVFAGQGWSTRPASKTEAASILDFLGAELRRLQQPVMLPSYALRHRGSFHSPGVL